MSSNHETWMQWAMLLAATVEDPTPNGTHLLLLPSSAIARVTAQAKKQLFPHLTCSNAFAGADHFDTFYAS